MELVIITGISGAGKTVALKTFEDMGYYCVDNLPVFLIPQFAELGKTNDEISRFAVGVDTRSGKDLESIQDVLETLDKKGIPYRILFLDASDPVLMKRYKESRRSHPLARTGRIEDGITLERSALEWLKTKADFVLDTSALQKLDLTVQLRKLMNEQHGDFRNMVISIMSFGYKYGIPEDSDLVFDVRFLPNPYYVENLKDKTGLSFDVRDFCINNDKTAGFLNQFYPFIDYLIPKYMEEGKNQLVISIGCTGGKHRSVSIAEELKNRLSGSDQYLVICTHRDILRQ